jgi:MarR family transcriptional regulator, lower aerobic nicotinate degradation pathway regulator
MGKAQELGIVDSMAQMSFAVHGFLERRASENGLSIIQTRLLGVLRDRKPAMNELARLLELDKSSVTGLVDRAERRGLVVRVPSVTDGRAVLVHLTREGRWLGARVASGFQVDISEFLGSLSGAEQRVLSELATRALVARATDKGVDLFVGEADDGLTGAE